MLIKTITKHGQILLQCCCQSGKISPNMVTLLLLLLSRIHHNFFCHRASSISDSWWENWPFICVPYLRVAAGYTYWVKKMITFEKTILAIASSPFFVYFWSFQATVGRYHCSKCCIRKIIGKLNYTFQTR